MALGEATQRLQEVLTSFPNALAASRRAERFSRRPSPSLWEGSGAAERFAVLAARAAASARAARLAVTMAERTGPAFDLGIAIDFGKMSVGRRGSRTRFKYGPWSSAWTLLEQLQQGRPGVTCLPLVIRRCRTQRIPTDLCACAPGQIQRGRLEHAARAL